MDRVERIVEQARRLSAKERHRLIVEFNKSMANGRKKAKSAARPAMKKRRAKNPYAVSLALAGTAHSDYSDVSSDKYKHLAHIYADNHEHS